MQVTTLSTQLGLRSELVDWYRDETSVPFGHLLIDLSPRTDDRLRSRTNTGSIPLKFYIPDRLKQSKILDDEHTKSFYSPSVPTIFPQMQKSFLSVSPKKVYPASLRMHNKSSQRKPAKDKKISRGKISKRGSTIVIELVSNASVKLYPDNTLSSFTNFYPEQLNLEGQWEVEISEISYPSMYQNVTEGKIMFFDKKLSKS